MASADIKSFLFKSSVALALVSSAGHIKMGFSDGLYKAWDGLPAVPRQSGYAGWDYMNVTFYLAAFLNWRWAKTGGPTTLEEKGMLVALVLGGLREGWGYFRIGTYKPLGVFWAAPLASLAAWLL